MLRWSLFGMCAILALTACGSSRIGVHRRALLCAYERGGDKALHEAANAFERDSSKFKLQDMVVYGDYLQYNHKYIDAVRWYRRADSIFRHDYSVASWAKREYLAREGVVNTAASLYPGMIYSCVQMNDSACVYMAASLFDTFPVVIDGERIVPPFVALEVRGALMLALGRLDTIGIKTLVDSVEKMAVDGKDARALIESARNLWFGGSLDSVDCGDDYACVAIKLMGQMGDDKKARCEELRSVLAGSLHFEAQSIAKRRYSVRTNSLCGIN